MVLMKAKDIEKLFIAIVGTEAAGLIGAFYTMPAISGWYAHIVKPAFMPPPWVFGPVWTTLYLLMGISLFLIWRPGYRHKKVRHAIWIYLLQLVLNVLWTIIFFAWFNPTAALAEIVLLWGMIIATMVVFWHHSRSAVWLLVPYLAWVTFAMFLNYQIVLLN